MKEGALIGAVVALVVYFLIPVYNDSGIEASILPTGGVVLDGGLAAYLNNLPLSMVVFFAFEILGISVGIASQMILNKH